MNVRPRLLDLYCGGGGAAMGYYRAGFDVVGVDNRPQPRYPFRFIQADALEFLDTNRLVDNFDAIHASPPCQGYSIMRNLPWLRDKEYPLLIEPTRERLIASGLPWVIENVMGAQRKAEMHAGWLCGQMFGLAFLRHRLFQASFYWLQPGHAPHWGTVRNGRTQGSRARDIVTVSMTGGLERNMRGKRTLAAIPYEAAATPGQRGQHGKHGGNGAQAPAANVGHAAGFALAKQAMGIDWMKREELTQAIPPAYCEYLGRWLMQALRC